MSWKYHSFEEKWQARVAQNEKRTALRYLELRREHLETETSCNS